MSRIALVGLALVSLLASSAEAKKKKKAPPPPPPPAAAPQAAQKAGAPAAAAPAQTPAAQPAQPAAPAGAAAPASPPAGQPAAAQNEEVKEEVVPDPKEMEETQKDAQELGVDPKLLHEAEAAANKPPPKDKGGKKKGGLKGKIQGIVQGLFKKVVDKALKLIESKVGGMEGLLAKLNIDISVIERWASYIKDGKPDTKRISQDLQKYALDFLIARIEPIAQGLITKGFELLRTATDPIMSSAVGALGSIPYAGGVLAAAASVAYNEGMKMIAKLILDNGMKLLKNLAGKLLGKITGKLLEPVLKQVSKWIEKSKLGKVVGTLLGKVEKLPGAIQKIQGMVEKIRSAAGARFSPAMEERVKEWSSRKLLAEKELADLMGGAPAEAPAEKTQQ
jgi:hypothetical protein